MIPAVKLDTVNPKRVYLTIRIMRSVPHLMTPATPVSPTPATVLALLRWSKTAPSRAGVQKKTESMTQENVAIHVRIIAELLL